MQRRLKHQLWVLSDRTCASFRTLLQPCTGIQLILYKTVLWCNTPRSHFLHLRFAVCSHQALHDSLTCAMPSASSIREVDEKRQLLIGSVELDHLAASGPVITFLLYVMHPVGTAGINMNSGSTGQSQSDRMVCLYPLVSDIRVK